MSSPLAHERCWPQTAAAVQNILPVISRQHHCKPQMLRSCHRQKVAYVVQVSCTLEHWVATIGWHTTAQQQNTAYPAALLETY